MRRSIFPGEPRSCLIHVAKMHSSGKWGAKGLGANIETDNLLVLGASPQSGGLASLFTHRAMR